MHKVGILVPLIFSLFAEFTQATEALVRFDDCHLVVTEWADGDSFMVKFPDGKEHVVRLYFADCPEMTASAPGDAARIRKQSRYFGLKNPLDMMVFGKEARAYVLEQLAEPFTVHTAFAGALGRSKNQRIYGMVTTANGEDLAELLVAHGLARAFGVKRARPDGTTGEEVASHLMDLEVRAAMERSGAWGKTDPDELIEGRRLNREDEALEDRLRGQAKALNVNSAGIEELKLLPGIGEVTATEIISARPFATLEELDAVPGIGVKTIEAITPYVRFSDE